MARWIDPEPLDVPEEIQQIVRAPAGLAPLVAGLLVRRGIADLEVVRGFLDPGAYVPASPWELPGLAAAIERIERAIARRERIAVWGDLDVDGQTATALYLEALRDLGANVTFYVPTRRESHGIHPAGVERLIDRGAGLILTADTGVDGREAIALAAGRGVDVLVTDHHDLPASPPGALALVNPKLLPPDHPLYELSGVGVAYEVTQALYEEMGRGDVEHLLDLVALGMVADVATLRADVRYLVQRGLVVLRSAGRLGLKEVMGLAGLDPAAVTEEEISFSLAPRLNAMSRVGQDSEAKSAAAAGVELLTTRDRTEARIIATELEALNARRRWLTRQTMDAALSQLDRQRALLDGPAIVVAGANWDPGIVGIVAGRLAERFHKPAIVLSAPPGEIARGSARSIEGVDIHAAIAAQRDMLYRCGGHPMAAGLSIQEERINEFRRALWRTLEQTAPPVSEEEIRIDACLPLDQVSLDLVQAIGGLAPFGPGNEAPVFVATGLTVASSAVIGRTREHRRLVVRSAQGGESSPRPHGAWGARGEAVVLWWQSADRPVPEGPFDLAYTVGVNTFRGEQGVQLTWIDARLAAPQPVEVLPERAVDVKDYRRLADPVPTLRAWVARAEPGQAGSTLVWGEGAQVAGVALCHRGELSAAETLVIWTAPPGPGELHAALEAASPRRVVLFGVDPGLDAPAVFLRRLAGLAKHALRAYGGHVALPALAAAMAHSEETVRLGLEWMSLKGQAGVTFGPRGAVTLRPGSGEGDTGSREDEERQHVLRGQLLAQLAEAAAYRAYFYEADAEGLVRGR
jgi:single-stranded-DNA-specific exonuclease